MNRMSREQARVWAQSEANLYRTPWAFWQSDPRDNISYQTAPAQAEYIPADAHDLTIVRNPR